MYHYALLLLGFFDGSTQEAPVTGTIAISADDATISVVQGSYVDILISLLRGEGYAGTVTLAVTGLPSGLTASYPDGQTFTGDASSRRVRLTAASDATPVSADAFTITASGADVDPDAVAGEATITEYVPPTFGGASPRSYVWAFVRRIRRR